MQQKQANIEGIEGIVHSSHPLTDPSKLSDDGKGVQGYHRRLHTFSGDIISSARQSQYENDRGCDFVKHDNNTNLEPYRIQWKYGSSANNTRTITQKNEQQEEEHREDGSKLNTSFKFPSRIQDLTSNEGAMRAFETTTKEGQSNFSSNKNQESEEFIKANSDVKRQYVGQHTKLHHTKSAFDEHRFLLCAVVFTIANMRLTVKRLGYV